MNKFRVGDRVRVVNRDGMHFEDYENGDTAVVTSAPDHGNWLGVQWEKSRFTDHREGARVRTLYPDEVERVRPTLLSRLAFWRTTA